MSRTLSPFRLFQALVFIPGILAIAYIFIYFTVMPDLSFAWARETATVRWVDPRYQDVCTVKPQDKIATIAGKDIKELQLIGKPNILDLIDPQNYLSVTLVGDEANIIKCPVTDLDVQGYLERLGIMAPALLFALSAVAVFVFMRPKDKRRLVLLAAFNLMAAWLATGALNNYNLFYSDYLYTFTLFLWSATFLHFLWIFPKPLARELPWIWAGIYIIAALLACAIFMHVLPITSPTGIGFGLVAVVGPILLGLHFRRRDQRHDVLLFVFGLVGAFLLALSTMIVASTTRQLELMSLVVYSVLPTLPFFILYPIYRKQMPGIEMRANQAFIWILFTNAVIIFVIISGVLIIQIATPETAPILGMLTTLITVILAVGLYPSFKRLLQKKLLKISFSAEELSRQYAVRIATSIEEERLIDVLKKDVLPALLIRQGALLRLDEHHQVLSVLLSTGLSEAERPTTEQVQTLLAEEGKYRPLQDEPTVPCPWVRLVLKLQAGDEVLGIFLFGKRDPDDFYSVEEIPTLRSFMSQTALALLNIEQTERLRVFHHSNIQRHEDERKRLARDLHDDVLGTLATFHIKSSDIEMPPALEEAYQDAVNSVRNIVTGLRPAMLQYGTLPAINELADGLMNQFPQTEIEVLISAEESPRYNPDLETHLFRITQEACNNAIRHGNATLVSVKGNLQADCIDLEICDNGKGFNTGESLDLSGLLTKHHFGLANIFERAILVGAKVQIKSVIGQGTRVIFSWQAK